MAAPAHAQARYRATRAENFRQRPGLDQRILGSVYEGTELIAGQTQDGWVEVILEGWIFGRSVGRTTRDGFDLAVTVSGGENLRATPGGRVLARLANGFLLDEVSRGANGWVQVRRTGWVWGQSLEPAGASPGPARPAGPGGSAAAAGGVGAAVAPAEPGPTAGAAGLDRAVTARQTEVHRIPDSEPTGSLAEDTPVRVLARSGEWVRIATEGWVRESDLRPSSPGVLAGVSGAEVRARPAEFEGKTVQWSVQYLALQTADELRREIPAGQRYMLARGPLPESGFIYVILSPVMVGRIEQVQPLAELVIIARIKAGRSQYLGNPVVELVDLAVRRP
ncbi:MAG: hypothetical protein HYV20_06750 [Gemmatimonadetes bacterium]|nr:hypothetical protein [Gemmatimonadota bacterium]